MFSCVSHHTASASASAGLSVAGHYLQPGPSTSVTQNPQQTQASILARKRQNVEQRGQTIEKRKRISETKPPVLQQGQLTYLRQIPQAEHSSAHQRPRIQLEESEFMINNLFVWAESRFRDNTVYF